MDLTSSTLGDLQLPRVTFTNTARGFCFNRPDALSPTPPSLPPAVDVGTGHTAGALSLPCQLLCYDVVGLFGGWGQNARWYCLYEPDER